jgi:G8 domain
MKNFFILLSFGIMIFSVPASAQVMTNYTFAQNSTGSLALDKDGQAIDMTTGTTTLIGASQNTSSGLVDIGFEFWYLGARYYKFNATTHGLLGLSSTNTIVTTGNSVAGGTGVRIGPLAMGTAGTNMATHSTGKVHYKVIGTAPNRVLVVEWLNMSINTTSTVADATFQCRLYEFNGHVEFVYGSMNVTAGAPIASVKIGMSSNSTAGTFHTLDITTNPAAVTDNTATAINNTLAAGNIAPLHTTTDGSRTVFRFNPTIPAAPTALNFTAVNAGGMTLNWTDNATTELGYVIYMSTDGITYNVIASTAANATSFVATGLSANTLYYWRVAAFNEVKSSDLSGSQATPIAGTVSNIGNGLWSNPANWTTGIVPSGSDDVTIIAGTTVTIDMAAQAYNLTINGSLVFETTTARTLTANANLTISNTGSLQSAASGTVTTHIVNAFGNITNNGILDLSTNANTAGAELRFSGFNNASLSGTGTTNDLFLLTANKTFIGAATLTSPTVEVMPSTLTIKGVSTSAGGFVNTTTWTGIIKFSGTYTFSTIMFATSGYVIPTTGGIWLNNANLNILGQANSPANNGVLRLTNGTLNVGTASGNSMGGGAGAIFQIEGGTMNCTGRFATTSVITYTMSGGTVNVATIGNASTTIPSFQISSTSALINISGGTINLVQRNSSTVFLDYNVQLGANITGGTLNVGTAATTTNFNFGIQGATPNLNITSGRSAFLIASLYIKGDLTVASTATLDASNQAGTGSNLILMQGGSTTNPGNIVNNGTIKNTAYTAATPVISNRLEIGSSYGAQTYSGSGTLGTNALPFSGINMANAAGFTVNSIIVTNRVNLFYGTISNAANVNIGNAGTSTPVIQVGGTATANPGGFASSPSFTPGALGYSLVYSATLGSVIMGTSNEISSTRTINNLSVSNPNGITLNGGNLTMGGALTFTAGKLTTSATNLLIMGAAATTSGAAATTFVNGPMVKNTNTTTAFTFPIGKNTTFRSMTITPSTTASTAYTAEYFDSEASNRTSLTAPIQAVISTEYFDLNATPATPAIISIPYQTVQKRILR